jgi:hypothetical protein
MRAFVAGVAAAIVLAIIAVYALDNVQRTTNTAYASGVSVRL